MRNKKSLIIMVSVILGILIIYFGAEKYQKYARIKELQDRKDYLQSEIDKIDAGDFSSYETESNTKSLSLSNLSAKSDGTYVNAYGSITNTSSQHIDEIGQITFFDEVGAIIKVKNIMVKLDAGETMHFEELIGLTGDGTSIPSSAELSGF
ncbi:hypothetical protein ACFTQ7_14435 [Lysinibacillus sp. NPDC056959]|uniref:hypothetical protein n=1 Tax=Lysinibacillus sp. NPDC056959 TaxID=3345981 RepID=UPI00362951E8